MRYRLETSEDEHEKTEHLVKNRHLVLDRCDDELLMYLYICRRCSVLAHGVDKCVVLAELTGNLMN
jgi:hypothetical protein